MIAGVVRSLDTEWVAIVRVIDTKYPDSEDQRAAHGPYKSRLKAILVGWFLSFSTFRFKRTYWVTESLPHSRRHELADRLASARRRSKAKVVSTADFKGPPPNSGDD